MQPVTGFRDISVCRRGRNVVILPNYLNVRKLKTIAVERLSLVRYEKLNFPPDVNAIFEMFLRNAAAACGLSQKVKRIRVV